MDNIWGADPVDMQLISKFNKGFRLLFYVIEIYRKYAQALHLNGKIKNYNY